MFKDNRCASTQGLPSANSPSSLGGSSYGQKHVAGSFTKSEENVRLGESQYGLSVDEPFLKTSKKSHACNLSQNNLITTYKACNQDFAYSAASNPKRVLTDPSERVNNNGYDNSLNNLILS
jgi:hypothetical protein